MSHQHNYAGNSILVDEVIETKGSQRQRAETSLRILDAQLVRRNVGSLLKWVGNADSDGIITVQEKQFLFRERSSIHASYSMSFVQAEKWHIEEDSIFTNFQDAYLALMEKLDELLANPFEDTEINYSLKDLFETYYQKLVVLENLIFQFTTGLLDGLDDRSKIEVVIGSSEGTSINPVGNEVILSASLIYDGENKTEEYDESCFNWERLSLNSALDDIWNSENEEMLSSSKTITITKNDLVNRAATFVCRFYYEKPDGLHYSQIGFLSITEQIPGPKGEDGRDATYVIPHSSHLFRFDKHLRSHKGILPSEDSNPVLLPNAGVFGFGGAVRLSQGIAWRAIKDKTWGDIANG